MGLVTDDLREWLKETQALPESESDENPFGLGAMQSAQAQVDEHLHGLWHRLAYRVWPENWICLKRNRFLRHPNARDNDLTTCRLFWDPFRFLLIAVAGWMNQYQLLAAQRIRKGRFRF